ncbi:hypothetical protein POTOM_044826 [Populus tomentosa]|uniref:DUF7875 domain-containing protein n=1 Tax=Populus tomentosa TaxID=118781 RepID=A0A8X7YC08_POPTO|nr:hypothetical protein POTOM_044826 [Populus tomentosa]
MEGFHIIGVPSQRNYWGHLRGSPACVGVESNAFNVHLSIVHAGPRITNPRSLLGGAICWSSTSALLVRLFSPECEPQNIAA